MYVSDKPNVSCVHVQKNTRYKSFLAKKKTQLCRNILAIGWDNSKIITTNWCCNERLCLEAFHIKASPTLLWAIMMATFCQTAIYISFPIEGCFWYTTNWSWGQWNFFFNTGSQWVKSNYISTFESLKRHCSIASENRWQIDLFTHEWLRGGGTTLNHPRWDTRPTFPIYLKKIVAFPRNITIN